MNKVLNFSFWVFSFPQGLKKLFEVFSRIRSKPFLNNGFSIHGCINVYLIALEDVSKINGLNFEIVTVSRPCIEFSLFRYRDENVLNVKSQGTTNIKFSPKRRFQKLEM